MRTITIKWTVSRARETHGYNIVTLREDGKVEARCNGGGYDMEGAVIGEWLEKNYQQRLNKLLIGIDGTIHKQLPQFYGLRRQPDGAVHVDGACGTAFDIAAKINVSFRRVWSDKSNSVYEILDSWVPPMKLSTFMYWTMIAVCLVIVG